MSLGGMATVTMQESLERKKRVEYAAYRMFCEKGIDSVTIEEIAKAAKVSAISIYRYFGTKGNLLLETQKILWQDIVQEISCTTIDHPSYHCLTGYGQVEKLLDALGLLYDGRGDYLKFAIGYKCFLLRHGARITIREHNEMLSPMLKLLLAALEKGRADGSLFYLGESSAICFSLWSVLRAYLEQIVISDNIYDGENRYLKQLGTVRALILGSIKNPCGGNGQPDCYEFADQ